MPKMFPLPDGRHLRGGHSTTHRDRRWPTRYVSRIWYNRSDGAAYVIMAYQHEQPPSARQCLWGIYRVEEWPGNFYYPEGNYALLKGPMIRRDALGCLVEEIRDDPGHQHSYWTDEDIIGRYRDKTSGCLTAFCHSCAHWVYNEQVESLIRTGAIEIRPSRWYSSNVRG